MRGRATAVGAFLALAAVAGWRVATAAPAPSDTAVESEVPSPEDDRPAGGPPEPAAAPAPVITRSPESYASDDVPALESLELAPPRWPPPKDADFESAHEVRLAHNEVNAGSEFVEGEAGCVAHELRGWLRLTCARFGPSAVLLGGSARGVTFAAQPSELTITMPLTPGDCRVVQLVRRGNAYWEGEGLIADGILSEIWIGTRGPHVAIHKPAMPVEM